MTEIAGLLIAGVTALSSIVQAYYAAKSANKDVSKAVLRKAEERAREPLKTGFKTVAEVIDADLLETLQNEIEVHNRRIIDALRSESSSNDEKSRKVEEARIQICRVLSEIKRFNNDSLPTVRLKNFWVSNQCKR